MRFVAGLLLGLGVWLVLGVFGVCSAVAGVGSPAWLIDSLALPTNFAAGDNAACAEASGYGEEAAKCDGYTVTVTDGGAKQMSGAIVIKDVVPGGLSVHGVSLLGSEGTKGEDFGGSFCSVRLPEVVCDVPAGNPDGVFGSGGVLRPDGTLEMFVFVTVNGPVSPGVVSNVVSVSGGGAGPVSLTRENTVGLAPPAFGLSGFSAPLLGVEGLAGSQAGGHPYEFAVKLDFNAAVREIPEGAVRASSVQDLRDVVVDLPAGLAGSAVATPQMCTLAQLDGLGVKKENTCRRVRRGASSGISTRCRRGWSRWTRRSITSCPSGVWSRSSGS